MIACLAALKLLKSLVFFIPRIEGDFCNYFHDKEHMSSSVVIPDYMINNGQKALDELLPRESSTKEVDLALLTLIYPYNIVSTIQRDQILSNIEKKLVRFNGVIRYENDQYYGNEHGEPTWTMGFPWLAIIYKQIGNHTKYNFYMKKTISVMNNKGELPELYYANTDEHNENSPLGWSQALYLAACKV